MTLPKAALLVFCLLLTACVPLTVKLRIFIKPHADYHHHAWPAPYRINRQLP